MKRNKKRKRESSSSNSWMTRAKVEAVAPILYFRRGIRQKILTIASPVIISSSNCQVILRSRKLGARSSSPRKTTTNSGRLEAMNSPFYSLNASSLLNFIFECKLTYVFST
jgi:hypothetical protein